ncbi:hypothetical protein CfE428DRAFT_0762 [Chthoniobacter flavus Ellin428]|uniref:Uncharacterized protein n=2 Tax=Chthoniobacter flavus TaxID=191863 RepID=B4CVS5_9BACT|nr:hypothetical protein CfE428DRAFT_0762 [Chthoniobacter flavus Ellin428]TCO95467.1 hypothetical protein EV701_101154 [Chthoniobacter flavus]
MPVEKLRERARILMEESERIIARASQIEAETRALVNPDTVRIRPDASAAESHLIPVR